MALTYAAKIVNNKEISMYEELHLKNLEDNYNEILELILLFSKDAIHDRLKVLNDHKLHYDKKFKPQIKEAKRHLKNTNSRLAYNMNKL